MNFESEKKTNKQTVKIINMKKIMIEIISSFQYRVTFTIENFILLIIKPKWPQIGDWPIHFFFFS